MTIHEPSTLLTDILLALWSGGLAWRLLLGGNASVPATRWWSRTLALTALSALVGGAYHGFAPNFPAISPAWWIAVLIIISLVSAALAMGLLTEWLPPQRQGPWRVAIIVKALAFVALVLAHPVFLVAIADYGSTLVVWTVAAIWLRRAWSAWMLAGVSLSVLAAIVQIMRLAPATWVNANDLYHLIQAVSLGAFYLGAERLTTPR